MTQNQYFSELTLRLRQVGFTVPPQEDGFLPVGWDCRPLCLIPSDGSVRYRPEDIEGPDRELACQRTIDLAAITAEYVDLLAEAPELKADGLGDGYLLLADFNGAVLAGHPTRYGTQFITWVWSYDRHGVSHGHYYEGDFRSAKQDFAVRSGLISRARLFTPEELTELYRATDFLLDEGPEPGVERLKAIQEARIKIEYTVPDLQSRLEQIQEQGPQMDM